MNKDLSEILDKYSEWFEMWDGDKTSPTMLINILSNLLRKERSLKEYYKERLDHHIYANTTERQY